MSKTKTVCLLTEQRIHAVALDPRGQPVARVAVDYVIPATLCHNDDLKSLAEAIAQSIHALEADSHNVTLVLPQHWCFCHVLEVQRRGTSKQTLEYAFEEVLPLPLEELTCAFAALGSHRVLAVAVPTSPMGKLLQLLEENGIEVDHITIDAPAVALSQSIDFPGIILLDATWARMAAHLHPPELAVVSAFGSDERNLAEELRQRDLLDSSTEYLRLDLGESSDLRARDDVASDAVGEPRTLYSQDAIDLIAVAAATVSSPDLRTGALLGRKHRDQVTRLTHHVLIAGILLLITWCTQLVWNQQTLRQHLEAVRAEQLRVYSDVFQATQLPPAAALRLASERIRLEGLTQAKAPLPNTKTSSPLDGFRDFVAALPDDIRVMLLDARLDEAQWTLRGQTVEHRDAERIVETLNAHAGLQAKPPRTTRLPSGGVEFTVVAASADPNRERTTHEP
ncbi:MAG: hypothetical protein AABZ47_00545 [Planctomycetota bacterium]